MHITYDLAGRKTSLNDPDMGVWEYTYDAADNLLSQSDACGSQTLLQYNAADQVTAKSFSAGTCGRIVPGAVSYTYNAAGQRTQRSDDSGSTVWSYDTRGRVSAEIRQWALGVFQTEWTYNSADLLSGVAYPDDNQGGTGEVVSYAYKAQGALSTVLGSDDYVTSTAYDEAGRLVSQGNATLSRSWSYYAWADPAGVGRTQGSSLSGQNGLNLLTLAYSYDALGDITSIQQGVTPDIQTQSFTYDSIQRLTSAQASSGAGQYPLETYSYDDAGRLAQKDGQTLTYAAGKHAALSKGSNNYSYDADGSLTQRVTAQGTFTYTYDVEGRLREARLNGALQATYLYDGDGGMVQKVVGETTTLYLGNLVEIELGAGISLPPTPTPTPTATPTPTPTTQPTPTMTPTRDWGCWPNCIDPPPDPTEMSMVPESFLVSGATEPVWRYYYHFGAERLAVREAGVLSYLFGDHLGSTTVTANPNGTLQSQTRYKPWGELRYSSGVVPTDYLYTGQRNALETGLYYYNARWYDSSLGRFAQADTLVPEPDNPMGWDRYAYVNNDPVNGTDPTGHAMKLDDEGNSHECPANTCYITMVGSTPALPYYPVSPITYAENIENTSSAGGSMDAMVYTLPDVANPNYTIKGINSLYEPSAQAGGFLFASDWAIYWRNHAVEYIKTNINVFAFYKVEGEEISVKSLDVQNPTGAGVTIKGVSFAYSHDAYFLKAGPGIKPREGYYGIGPSAQPNSTTSINLIPSGYSSNLTNTFPKGNVNMIVRLVDTGTGMQYKWIRGIIK